MCQRAAYRSVHLRHATQAVCILNPRIVGDMRLTDLAVFHQGQKMFGRGFLPRMRSCVLQTEIECNRRAFHCFETHRAGDIGYPRKALCTQERQSAYRVHGLRAVEQRQAFLRFEFQRI